MTKQALSLFINITSKMCLLYILFIFFKDVNSKNRTYIYSLWLIISNNIVLPYQDPTSVKCVCVCVCVIQGLYVDQSVTVLWSSGDTQMALFCPFHPWFLIKRCWRETNCSRTEKVVGIVIWQTRGADVHTFIINLDLELMILIYIIYCCAQYLW